ncbi:Gliding motility-associated ABC transporter ATP-binding protein GldA [hydrothermal vent metagenome]|uniref:Gliding motility-associated ABC transporter ATP-binding protein GldA n=1 Tax=hydrothermal vent metagenome TaxID=652676 RepID=A0A3B1A1G7_9ZZZZ
MDQHTTPLLQVESLSRHYGKIKAVNGISFSLKRGEVLGFLGPNGAGKSTTMKMITGNLAPTSGSAIIDGFDILDDPKQAKAALGFLPEQPPLYKELTVDEYLNYAARLNRMVKSTINSAVDNSKQRCGLEQMGKRLIGNLSKGYQQRVGIAQAIIHSPALVLLDEPTVGLDPIQIREIRQLIRELGQSHSVILSTHILPEVQATCDRVQIINQGELVFNDTIDNLSERMQTTALLLRFKRPPSTSTMLSLAGVQDVESVDKQTRRIHFLAEQDPTEALVNASVSEGWGLFELTPERMSLEEVFVDLTCREPHHDEVVQP